MPFQPAVNAVEVVNDYLVHGKATANRLIFLKAGAYTQSDVDLLAANQDNAIFVGMLPHLSHQIDYVGTRVRGLTVENDFTASFAAGAGAGALTEDTVSNQVSLCLTLRSGSTGRSARGRFYCQPPTTAQMGTSNTVTTTYLGQMQAAVQMLHDDAAGLGWTLVVCSRFHAGAARSTAVFFPVLSIVVRNNRVDTQRNRMPVPD